MADYDASGGMQIGEVLKSTRTRQGLDMRTVEEETKIRTKYLRALESEDWEVLPSTAYAKGFLRTYAQLLGLDADALVDEYRRQIEATRPAGDTVGGKVLARPRRPGERPEGPRLGPMAGIAAAVAVVFLLLLGLTGGSSDDETDDRAERREARQERQERRRERRQQRRREARQGAQEGPRGPLRLRLAIDANVRVCLIGDGEQPLVDGQVLPAGTEEDFEADRFRLGFPSGYEGSQFRLFLDGERVRLPATTGPAAYRIRGPARVRRAPDPGPGCP